MKKYVVNIGLALLVLSVILLVFLSQAFAGFLAVLIRIVILGAVAGLSIYKLALWYRYRNDPEKREAVVYSSQIYPARIRRFLMDEKRGPDETRRSTR